GRPFRLFSMYWANQTCRPPNTKPGVPMAGLHSLKARSASGIPLPKTAANQLETIVHIRLAVRALTAATIHQSATLAASRPGCRKSAARRAIAVLSEWASNFHTLCVVVPGLDSRINPTTQTSSLYIQRDHRLAGR